MVPEPGGPHHDHRYLIAIDLTLGRALVEPVQAVAVAVASLAALLDLRTRRIPNWLTGAAFVGGIVLNSWLAGPAGAGAAVLGAALGLGLLLPFYVLRAMGAGDVKLLAALGALLAPHGVAAVAVYGALVGGGMSLLVLALRGRLIVLARQALVLQRMPPPSGLTTPYGVAIAAGVYLSFGLPPVFA